MGSSLKELVGRDQFLTGGLDCFTQSCPLLHPGGNVSKQRQELSKKGLGHSTAPKTQELVTVQSLVIFMFSQHLHVIGIYECINIPTDNKPIHKIKFSYSSYFNKADSYKLAVIGCWVSLLPTLKFRNLTAELSVNHFHEIKCSNSHAGEKIHSH